MKKQTVLLSLVLLALASSQLLAQSPVLSIQGLVQKSFGAALEDGTYSLTFKLYDMETSGTALWMETQDVEVTGGVYSALLGSVTNLTLPFDTTYYLGVTVESGAELLPRARLTSTPYALALIGQSNVFPSSGNVGVGTASPTAGFMVKNNLASQPVLRAQSFDGTERMTILDNGNIGVGTTTATERLHVNGNIRLSDDSDIFGMDIIRGFNDLHFQGDATGGTDLYVASGGNVGVGTSSPSDRLHVSSSVDNNGTNATFKISTGTQDMLFDGNEIDADDALYLNNNSANDVLLATGGGDVGIGTTSPEFKLHVNGTIAVETMPFFDGGNVQWSTTNQQFGYDNSSRRFKENITPLAEDFFKILDLQPVRYTRPGRPDRWELGFIAEEADSLGLTRLVEYGKNGQVEGFNYEKALTYVLPILKRQQAQIEALQNEVAALKSQAEKVQALEAKFAALSALLEKGQTAAGE